MFVTVRETLLYSRIIMSNKEKKKSLLRSVFDLVDAIVELYLKTAIAPFLGLHEKFYTKLNQVLRRLLEQNRIPRWFTANFITYFRTVLVFPTVLLLACGYQVLPAVLVIFVDLADFLDGVVARFWVDRAKLTGSSKGAKDSSKDTSRSASPASDKDGFGTFIDIA